MSTSGPNITGFLRRGLGLIALVVLIIGIALALYAGRHILLAAFLGFVFANAMHRSANKLSHHTPIPQVAGIAIMLTLFVLLGFAVVWVGVTIVAQQADEFLSSARQVTAQTQAWLEQYPWGKDLVNSFSANGMAKQGLSLSADAMTAIFNSIGPIAVFIVVAMYGTIQPGPYRNGLLEVMPRSWQDRAKEVLSEVSTTLLWWITGRLASMAIVGLLTTLGLWILGIPAAIALGVIAALLSFIPNLGPLLSVVPAVFVASTLGGWEVLWVVLLYIGIQAVESNAITPLIQQRAVHVPAAMLITFQLIMGVLAGVWGMIVATPLLIVLTLLVQMLFIHDFLGKDCPLLSRRSSDAESDGAEQSEC